ncbi:MAG: hypothetical protein Q8N18_15635 [Opitutaceae bacterium]|nr:hypothetical protein [Opitutaceae bacterium]
MPRAARAGEVVVVGGDGGREERLDAVAIHRLEFTAVIVDGAVLGVEDEALVVRVKAVEAGKDDSAVSERFAGILPRGDLILAVPAEGEIVVHAAFFKGHVDRGVLEGLVADGDGPARLIVEVPVAPALVVLVEAEQAHREFLRDDHAVVVGLVALLVPRAEHRLERGAVALEVGLFAGERDEAARLPEAKQDRVGAARDFSALHVVEIDGHARLDEIARGARRRAAHAELVVVAVGAAALGVVEAGVGILDVDLDVGRVREHLLEVGRGDVGEKLGRKRRDRGGRVLEAGVEARAAGRVRGLVAHVVLGANLEGREFHRRGGVRRLRRGGGRAGRRCRCRRGLRGSQRGQRGGEQTKHGRITTVGCFHTVTESGVGGVAVTRSRVPGTLLHSTDRAADGKPALSTSR